MLLNNAFPGKICSSESIDLAGFSKFKRRKFFIVVVIPKARKINY